MDDAETPWNIITIPSQDWLWRFTSKAGCVLAKPSQLEISQFLHLKIRRSAIFLLSENVVQKI